MFRMLFVLVAAAACGDGAPPACDQVVRHTNRLYDASRAGRTRIDGAQVDRAMAIKHHCAKLTERQRRCIVASKALADTDRCQLPGLAPLPAAAAPSCREVGAAWADYLLNRNRRSADWKTVAADVEGDCDRNTWPAAERSCWAAIHDAASHQRCLDLRKQRERVRRSKPPPPDPDDVFEDDDAE